MKILAIIFCIATTLNLCAHENDCDTQENDFKRMLMIKNIPASEITDFCLDSPIKGSETTEISDTSPISLSSEQSSAVEKSLFYTAYSVSIQNLHGHLYHVADYYDGTKVITCLTGEHKGLQGVAVNGKTIVTTVNVIWFNNYFVHYYPTGKISSDANQQVIEVY
jgi:hypothetical protein